MENVENNVASKSTQVLTGRQRRLQNLKPFPKGVSGNPGGKPKHDLAVEISRLVWEENREAIYKVLKGLALKGDMHAIEFLANRAYGKCKDRVELTGEDGAPVLREIRFVRVPRKTDVELGLAPMPGDLQSRIDAGQLTRNEAFSILRDRKEREELGQDAKANESATQLSCAAPYQHPYPQVPASATPAPKAEEPEAEAEPEFRTDSLGRIFQA